MVESSFVLVGKTHIFFLTDLWRTLIYSAAVAIVTSAGMLGWLAMEALSILTIFVTFIIYVVVRIYDCAGDKDFADPYYAEDADVN